MLAGSWGKSTEVRRPRDIDVLFVLPPVVFERYQLVVGNRQSQLLQEIRAVLARTFTTTTMRADGQVILVPFATYSVEVVPAFNPGNGQYWICDTNDGGRYKTTDPNAEIFHVGISAAKNNGNARSLNRRKNFLDDLAHLNRLPDERLDTDDIIKGISTPFARASTSLPASLRKVAASTATEKPAEAAARPSLLPG